MQLLEIARGWFNFTKGTSETQQMMAHRLQICDSCPKKAQMTPAGQMLVKVINKESSTYYCTSCSCPLAGKTANPKQQCPIGKWKTWEKPESNYP